MSGGEIRIAGVRKTYPPRNPGEAGLEVLKGLDVTIDEHEFVCILGPSGCGKSTLLGLVSGLDRDYQGEIRIDGQPMGRKGPPVRIGYMFQEPRLLPWLSAEKNVEFALSNCNVPRDRWAELKDRYFTITKLNDFRHYYPHQLSGGMRQRVALVRALCIEPGILLMDEPFSGLDELTARKLRVDLLAIWREMRKTIVFVTHNAYEASYLADRILIMSRGEIQEEVKVDVPRPRQYDDTAVFEVNRHVVQTFLRIADSETDELPEKSVTEEEAVPAAARLGPRSVAG